MVTRVLSNYKGLVGWNQHLNLIGLNGLSERTRTSPKEYRSKFAQHVDTSLTQLAGMAYLAVIVLAGELMGRQQWVQNDKRIQQQLS